MDPVDEALASKDAERIKKVRAVEKGDVTRISNRLEIFSLSKKTVLSTQATFRLKT